MVAVFIDNKRCDVEIGVQIDENIFSFDADSFDNLDAARAGRTLSLRLPISPENDRLMGFAADPVTAQQFNATYHEGRVEVDGVILHQGVATLKAIEGEKGAGDYLIQIRDGAGDWIDTLASRSLDEAPLSYEATLDYSTIEQSWQDDAVVRFLPVRYDDYSEPYDSSSLYAPQRVMTTADYHPFISVVEMLHAIFNGAGYSIESRFLASDQAKKLYFSGCYPSSGASLTRMENSSGFKAGRSSDATTTADAMGRAWMTPLVLTSSVGNFVETTEGDELYNNRGVLQISDQGIEYTPKVEANVGFEIFLKYNTSYKMISSQRLQGFDALYVDTGCDLEIPIANPFKDRRTSAVGGVQYKCFVFEHQEGISYSLIYRSASGDTTVASFSADEATITMPSVSGGSCLLLCSDGQEYSGDWALYDGYVSATGKIDVEVTLRTPPETLSPSKRKSFTRMYMHGAQQGQEFTLSSLCTLRPIFSSSPSLGSALTGATLLNHNATQREFVEAIQQMFNLRIATIEPSKKVYIEPYDNFYDGTLRDVSIYADRNQRIRATDLATEICQHRTLCYRSEGDGAVARYNAQNEEHFAEWSTTAGSYVAKMGRERRANPLFCPTISSTGIYGSAPSAMIMQVGDRDADTIEEVSMRVVRYEGMRPLAEGERWGAPSFGKEYPFAAFHSPEEFTLCFEDRDGVQGLHRYYDREWREQSTRRRINLSLTLPAHALPTLVNCSEGGGARDIYRLNIAGQRASYYLRRIEGYDLATRSARCDFVRCAED